MKFFAFCLILCLIAAQYSLTAADAVGLYGPDRYDGIPEMCLMPMDFGYCRAKVKRYYFDMRRMKCTTFFWGGCAGNINNFKSLDECNKVCLDAFEADSDQVAAAAPSKERSVNYSSRDTDGNNNSSSNDNKSSNVPSKSFKTINKDNNNNFDKNY